MLRAAGRRWKSGIDSSAGKTALSHASTSAPGGELVSVSSGLVSAVKHLAFPFGAQTLQCVHRLAAAAAVVWRWSGFIAAAQFSKVLPH